MVLIRLLGAVGLIAGGVMGYLAYNETLILGQVLQANAVQVTQVYTEANYYVLLGIACFLFAVIMGLADVAMAVNNLVTLEVRKKDK